MPIGHGRWRPAAWTRPLTPDNAATMRIQLLSDLHLEVHPQFQPRPAPGADLLVLAGDIGSYQAGSQLTDDDFGLGRFSPREAGWPVPVLYVPGNHEYDGLAFDAAHARLRATCERLGITWLERETVVLGGVRFVGTTLWSDFDSAVAELPLSPKAARKAAAGSPLTARLQLHDKALRAADFWLAKTGTTRGGAPFLAEQVRELALECRDWLAGALAQPFEGPTVAVTHFAPSLRSADPRYGLTPGTAGFCNAFDSLFPHADLWLHGHLHCAVGYTAGGCEVRANPLGYARKGEQDAFREAFTVAVPGTENS